MSALHPMSLSPDRTHFAIVMVLVGTFTIASADLATKWLTHEISLWQLQSMRSAIAILLLLPLLWFSKKLSTIHVKNVKAVILRSLLMTLCYLLFFASLATIPIALVAGGYYSAPLFMVLLSWVMLGESVGRWRLFSVLGGFVGVLLILQPSSEQFEPILLLPVVCGFSYALSQVFTRKYCKDESPMAISYWLTVMFLLSGLIGLAVLAIAPPIENPGFLSRPLAMMAWDKNLLLVVVALASLIMHFSLAAAYQSAPASLIAPLEYLYLPITVIGGYAFFDETPTPFALLGIAIIIIAGLIIAWRERKLSS